MEENVKNICSVCSTENDPYVYVCSGCGNYLRSRIYNIDLWNVSIELIDSPASAFKKIIFAEHKNFLFVLLFLISIKYLILSRFISIPSLDIDSVMTSTVASFLIIFITGSLFLIIYSSSFRFALGLKQIRYRIKDILAVIIYAHIPLIISAVILFPVELVIFGKTLFSNNPTPFQLNETTAYLLAGIEIIFLAWFMLLVYLGNKSLSGKKLFAIAASLKFIILLSAILWFLSELIFTL